MAINNKLSGGLPHSEIHGSKLILSSSWLIAEYHVLHRLLLPRHSPNALLALDLIQKEKDSLSEPKAYIPASSRDDAWSVYLTWTTPLSPAGIHERARETLLTCRPPKGNRTGMPAHAQTPNGVDCISLNDIKGSPDWTAKHCKVLGDLIVNGFLTSTRGSVP